MPLSRKRRVQSLTALCDSDVYDPGHCGIEPWGEVQLTSPIGAGRGD